MTDSSVGRRLGRYIGEGPQARMSIRAFAGAMQQRKPRPTGSTRAMVHRYLSGTAPPADFIEAAAAILRINTAWLAFDEGHPTAERATAAGVADAAMEEWRSRAGGIVESVYGALGVPEWATSPEHRRLPYWVAPVAELEILRGFDVDRVAGALAGFLAALGENAADMEEARVSDYIMSMIPVVQGLAHRRDAMRFAMRSREDRDEAIRRSIAAIPRTNHQTQEAPDV